jgi:integrase
MPRKRQQRIYSKGGRWYGDFRDYAAEGGKQEALIPELQRRATMDEGVARTLAEARLRELKRLREGGYEAAPGLDLRRFGQFVDDHLVDLAKRTRISSAWLEAVEHHLQTAIDFFGQDTLLRAITVRRVEEYARHLATAPRWGGRRYGTVVNDHTGTISGGTQRQYLNSLSKLLNRAVAHGFTDMNPVAALQDKPRGEHLEADWLEVHDAALLLYAAELYAPKHERGSIAFVHAVVATLLLTGGRMSEVLGLRVQDVDFVRSTVTFRAHAARRLKTASSQRVVPLWPQLAEILREHVARRGLRPGTYLFPSPEAPSKPLSGSRKFLSELSMRLDRGPKLDAKTLRHTYCAARLQTLDGGHPVAAYTVERELGHASSAMVRKVYGHLGAVRHRSEVVEFRVDQHEARLGDRIQRLVEVSAERNVFQPHSKNRVPLTVEIAVLQYARSTPDQGSRVVAAALGTRGLEVSASGVGWIWRRHALNSAAMRRAAAHDGSIDRAIEGLLHLEE